MTKGTPTLGQRGTGRKLHIACRRCGHNSFHISKKICSWCGFGKSAKRKHYNWAWKKKEKN